jgi:3-methyladenine DNA glycosylase/8-oxoguanine DNA glycosylase
MQPANARRRLHHAGAQHRRAADIGEGRANRVGALCRAAAHHDPGNVLKLKIDDMRAAGLSARKVDYLVDLALHFDNGKLHVKDWAAMDDEAIIAELVAIRGIGRWTAEMFLIFYLMRPMCCRWMMWG